MAKTAKTNAARLLDAARVAYELVAYDVDPADLSATHVAATLGIDPALVFKTIVLVCPGHPVSHLACVVPAAAEVDLKRAAAAAGVKKAEPLPLRELQPLTGYIRGGCTAIGMKRPMPVFLDASAAGLPYIYVSAGQRGLQFKISPQAYAAFTGATLASITTTPPRD